MHVMFSHPQQDSFRKKPAYLWRHIFFWVGVPNEKTMVDIQLDSPEGLPNSFSVTLQSWYLVVFNM